MPDQSTQEYLDAAQTNREQEYADLFARETAANKVGAEGEDYADVENEIDDSILAIEVRQHFTVQISMGGPAEWIEAYCIDGEVVRAEFCCGWWSPTQRTEVTEGSALWRLTERMNPYQYV